MALEERETHGPLEPRQCEDLKSSGNSGMKQSWMSQGALETYVLNYSSCLTRKGFDIENSVRVSIQVRSMVRTNI